ncbi:MAG: hypothetical protein QE271_10060 [Bacteriovoracaceae bacterium]|nr:hypothetical protein [Bacteriovoracaceae bacterium]
MKYFFKVILFLCPLFSFAQLSLNGRLLGSGIAPSSNTGQWIQKNLWGSLQVEKKWEFKGEIKSQIFYTYSDSPYFILAKNNEGTSSKLDLSELEFSQSVLNEKIKLVAGKSIVKWGRMDGPSPLDVFRTRRQQLIHPDSYWQDRGEWMGQLKIPQIFSSPWSLNVAHSWRGEATDIILPKSNVPFSLELQRDKNESHFIESNSRPETGLQLTYTGDRQDFELVGFDGYEHLSLLETQSVNLLTTPAFVYLRPLHLKKKVVGGSWSKALENWVLRAESSYVDYSTNNYLLYQDVSQANGAFGVERSFFEDLRVIAEIHYTRQLEFEKNSAASDSIQAALRLANRSILGPLNQDKLGLLIHLFYSQDSAPEWKYELTTLSYARDNAGVISPKLTYEWMDGLKSNLFSNIYWGENRSPLGQLKSLNAIGASVEYFY